MGSGEGSGTDLPPLCAGRTEARVTDTQRGGPGPAPVSARQRGPRGGPEPGRPDTPASSRVRPRTGVRDTAGLTRAPGPRGRACLCAGGSGASGNSGALWPPPDDWRPVSVRHVRAQESERSRSPAGLPRRLPALGTALLSRTHAYSAPDLTYLRPSICRPLDCVFRFILSFVCLFIYFDARTRPWRL